MLKKPGKSHFSFIVILLLSLAGLAGMAFKPHHPAPGAIVLQNEAVPISAPSFYVAGVQDERANSAAIALLAPDAAVPGSKPVETDLQGGTMAALRSFIYRNLDAGNKQRAVIIGVKKVKLVETVLPDRRVEGKVSLLLSFNLKRPDDTLHLIDYNGGMHYIRPVSSQLAVESSLRRSLLNALNYFNNWMNREADNNVHLATAIRLSFTDIEQPRNEDTVYYSTERPLNWGDFKDKVRSGRYAAEVFPGFAFDEHVVVENSIIKIKVAMKVFLPKNESWARYDSQNAYVLNHEQRHFDIVKIISERYKQQMLHTRLPVENYDGQLYSAYFEALHQMNVMQDEYDDETHHGLDEAAQEQWNQKIADELKSYGIVTADKALANR